MRGALRTIVVENRSGRCGSCDGRPFKIRVFPLEPRQINGCSSVTHEVGRLTASILRFPAFHSPLSQVGLCSLHVRIKGEQV